MDIPAVTSISDSTKKDVDIYATNEAIRDIGIYALDKAVKVQEQEVDGVLKAAEQGNPQVQSSPKIGKDGVGEKLDISGKL